MTLLYFSAQNIDRLVSFYRASLKTGKIFVIDFYTANILGCLKDYARIPYPSKDYANIKEYNRNIIEYNRDSYFYEIKIIKKTVSFGEHEF